MARRSRDDIVNELEEHLRLAGKPCMTLPWPDFYRLCGRVRMKQPFLDELRELASARFQLIVAYGRNAVVVCHDRNFADIAREPWWRHDGGG